MSDSTDSNARRQSNPALAAQAHADRAAAPAQAPAAIGVLFVHGIGAQSRGRTLTDFASPVVAWLTGWYNALHDRWAEQGLRFEDLEAWIAARSADDPRLLDALRSLLDRLPRRGPGDHPVDVTSLAEGGEPLAAAIRLTEESDGDGPRCARLEITKVSADGQVQQSSWLLAEAWWAETFPAPSFSELAQWGLGTIARTIGSHFGVRVRRALDRLAVRRSALNVLALPVALVQLLLAVYASVAALAGLALLLLLGAVPIPRLRSAIARLQLLLADSVGDSFVLVSQPLQAAAIVGSVRRDLCWLADRAQAVAVVAHSQGGAIMNEVLRRELAETDPARRVLPIPTATPDGRAAQHGQLRHLITLGSGLRKLDELQRLLGPHQHFRRSALLTVGGVLLVSFATLALFAGYLEGVRQADLGGMALLATYGIVGLGLLVSGMADLVADAGDGELEWWAEQLERTGIEWTDYAASDDPVPNGRLFSGDRAFPEHRTVHNRRSLTADHTSYWSNVEQFVTDVLARLAKLDPVIEGDVDSRADLLEFAQRRRQWRVAWLVAIRWAAAVATLAVLGRTLGIWLPALADGARRLLALAGIGTAPQVDVAAALSALAPAAAMAGVFLLASAIWRAWDAHEGRQLLSRRRPGSGSMDVWFLFAATVVAVTAVVAAVPGVGFGPRWSVATFFGLMIVWLATQVMAGAFAGSGDASGRGRATRAEVFASRTWSLASVVAMLLGWALFAVVAWRWLTRWPAVGATVIAAVSLFAIISLARAWQQRRAGSADRRG